MTRSFIYMLFFAVTQVPLFAQERSAVQPATGSAEPILSFNVSFNSEEIDERLLQASLDPVKVLTFIGIFEKLSLENWQSLGETTISGTLYENEVQLVMQVGDNLGKLSAKEPLDWGDIKFIGNKVLINTNPESILLEQIGVTRNRLLQARISQNKLFYAEVQFHPAYQPLLEDYSKERGVDLSNPFFQSLLSFSSLTVSLSLTSLELGVRLNDSSMKEQFAMLSNFLLVTWSNYLLNEAHKNPRWFQDLNLSKQKRDTLLRIVQKLRTTIFDDEIFIYTLLHELEAEALQADLKILIEEHENKILASKQQSNYQLICNKMEQARFSEQEAQAIQNPNEVTLNFSRTLLHCAVIGKQVAVIRALLKNGADLNAQDYDEETVLHLAARSGDLEVIKILVQSGVDRDIVNIDDLTAYDIAEEEGFTSVLQLLVPATDPDDFLLLED